MSEKTKTPFFCDCGQELQEEWDFGPGDHLACPTHGYVRPLPNEDADEDALNADNARLRAEVTRLTAERESHAPEGRNVTNAQHVEVRDKVDALTRTVAALRAVLVTAHSFIASGLDNAEACVALESAIQGVLRWPRL